MNAVGTVLFGIHFYHWSLRRDVFYRHALNLFVITSSFCQRIYKKSNRF
jgi:hypothetical protein